MFGADYIRQDWSKANFGPVAGISYSPGLSHIVRAGFSISPTVLMSGTI